VRPIISECPQLLSHQCLELRPAQSRAVVVCRSTAILPRAGFRVLGCGVVCPCWRFTRRELDSRAAQRFAGPRPRLQRGEEVLSHLRGEWVSITWHEDNAGDGTWLLCARYPVLLAVERLRYCQVRHVRVCLKPQTALGRHQCSGRVAPPTIPCNRDRTMRGWQ